jgi:hypothetical protein
MNRTCLQRHTTWLDFLGNTNEQNTCEPALQAGSSG